MLVRMLVEQRRYEGDQARQAYVFWLDSGPFDCGNTVRLGLRGQPNLASQANGAMMRISPLGIFGANYELQQVAEWARQDAILTHPNALSLQANELFAMAVAHTIANSIGSQELYRQVETWAREMNAEESLLNSITGATMAPPSDYIHQQGWVLMPFATRCGNFFTPELGRRGGGYHQSRRGHRYECGYHRRTSRCCVWPRCRPCPVGREASELSPGRWTAAHTPP
jgi:ADP-ribosylglycohydrolase